MCVLCHQPQNADPVSGNSLDLKVMAHKIHMGSHCPASLALLSYARRSLPDHRLRKSVNDFSKVVDPAIPADARFATARPPVPCNPKLSYRNRAALPAVPATTTSTSSQEPTILADSRTTTPSAPTAISHRAKSVRCVHHGRPRRSYRYRQDLSAESRYAARWPQPRHTSVTNTSAGQKPTVNFTLQDDSGNNLPLSETTTLELHHGRSYHGLRLYQFRSDTTNTPGYVTETRYEPTCSRAALAPTLYPCHPRGRHWDVHHRRGIPHHCDGARGGTTSSQSVESGRQQPGRQLLGRRLGRSAAPHGRRSQQLQ